MSTPYTPSLLAALSLLAPGCTEGELPDDADALAFEIDETVDEDEVTARFGGDPSVSQPDAREAFVAIDAGARPGPDELSSDLDPSLVAKETSSLWGGVQRITDWYEVPLFAEAAWASPDTPGCSGTMIAPNLLMVASHCGADWRTEIEVQGRVYRDRDLGQKLEEDYDCSLLFHTFPETDLAIYHCPPAPGELSLGDRFGWADVDVSHVYEGQILFSVFSNSLVSFAPGVPQHLLTLGEAEEIGLANHWANPNLPNGSLVVSADQALNQDPQVVQSNLWGQPGASGSAQFNTKGHIAVGPLSTAPEDGGPLRRALDMYDYHFSGWIYERMTSACPWKPDDPECHTDNSVNGSSLAGLGLDPTDYEDRYADQDLDYFFDLPSDVTDLEGENPRDVYHLRFTSRRQNRWWQAGPASTIEHYADGLSFDTAAHDLDAWIELARHERLNLDPYRTYSVTLALDSDYGWYRVCTDGPGLSCSPWFFDAAGTSTAHTLEISTGAGGEALVLQGWNAEGSIADVTLTEHAQYLSWVPGQGFQSEEIVRLSFDAFDDRNVWRDPEDGDRPWLTPDGEGTDVDWAGYLYTTTTLTGYDYDLSTDALPIADGENTLCFQHRRDDAIAWDSSWIYMRVQRQSGAYVTGRYVVPGTAWGETCATFDTSVAAGEALEVRFGIYGVGDHSGSAFIDGVELTLP